MAQDRFFFWRGYYDAMMMLDDADAGRLVKMLGAYAFEGIEPEVESGAIGVAWLAIRDQARESVEIGRLATEYGKRGGRPKKGEEKNKKRDPERGPLTTPKRVPKRGPERVPESVRYGKVPISTDGCAHSDSRPVRACGEPWPTHVRDWTTDLVDEWKAWAPTGDPEWWAAYQGGTRPGPWLEALA